ncbi:threonine/serine exporter family protein [Aliivibrio logei]|uniref:Threonine/serine exporter-like N-terminal domain-containing protein n=3 Tax=Aliivibrio TaxID=511678 RepID=A0A1B9P0F4_ALILO|nr:threonine/serine exporter family protein [Aliivibrio logei]OCH21838.1 hypothetical protein A6E04_08225 [Aliivibrio logei]OEF09807.1 hypothetical protein A1Q5_14085 [Aliivibrio logei 5S-186]
MPSQYRIKRIVEIGDTLHRCGCAPYKVERYTTFYANKYGIECMIQATPTSINYQFPDDDNAVIMKRHKPAGIDLGLLANTIIRLQQPLNESSPPAESIFFPTWMVALANICIPPAFLMLVGSTYEALWVSFLLGFIVWGCQTICTKRRSIAVEFFSALVITLIVTFIASLGFPIPILGLCIAAIVLFVPGLSIANALECLAFNDLVSGTSLLGQCFLTLIKLFIGIIIGFHIGDALWTIPESVKYQNEFPLWLQIAGLPLISFCLGVMFKARFQDMIYSLPVAVLGMWGPFYLGFDGGWVVGTWVTTVLITLYGTWIAKRLNLTGIIFIIQGIIILVPGSRVLVSASQSVFQESILPIPSIGLSALFMFSAIVAGQITAYSIYSPKIDQD